MFTWANGKKGCLLKPFIRLGWGSIVVIKKTIQTLTRLTDQQPLWWFFTLLGKKLRHRSRFHYISTIFTLKCSNLPQRLRGEKGTYANDYDKCKARFVKKRKDFFCDFSFRVMSKSQEGLSKLPQVNIMKCSSSVAWKSVSFSENRNAHSDFIWKTICKKRIKGDA